MQNFILEHARTLLDLSWIYLIIIAVTAIDSFLPVVPAEALLILCGVFAAEQDRPELTLVILAGAAGAFVGDNISYAIGRTATGPVNRWVRRGAKRQRGFDWAQTNIAKHGGLILVMARYLPGGRTITTLTMGVVAWPHRKFMFFDVVATGCWATYASLIGFIGGRAFERNPLLGLLLGLILAMLVGTTAEVVRRVRSQRSGRVGS